MPSAEQNSCILIWVLTMSIATRLEVWFHLISPSVSKLVSHVLAPRCDLFILSRNRITSMGVKFSINLPSQSQMVVKSGTPCSGPEFSQHYCRFRRRQKKIVTKCSCNVWILMCGGHGMEKLYVEYSPEDICLVKCKGSDFSHWWTVRCGLMTLILDLIV